MTIRNSKRLTLQTAGLAIAAGVLALSLATGALAQRSATVDVASGKEVRVDWIGTVSKTCIVGEPPVIVPASVAGHGVVKVVTATVTTRRIPSCPEMQVPARVVFYRSSPGYKGEDNFTLRIGKGEKASTKTYLITVR